MNLEIFKEQIHSNDLLSTHLWQSFKLMGEVESILTDYSMCRVQKTLAIMEILMMAEEELLLQTRILYMLHLNNPEVSLTEGERDATRNTMIIIESVLEEKANNSGEVH